MSDNRIAEVTQADREAFIDYEKNTSIGLNPTFCVAIRAGDHDADRRIQAFARHREAHRTAASQASDAGEATFVRDDQCNVEFGTVPDCDCPHEHWHMGGICLDVHIEDDGSGHAVLADDDWQLEVKGVANLDEMRAIAFGWASQKYGITAPPTSDAGEEGFQDEVGRWMLECFGEEIAADRIERADRFIEEALELAQAIPGFTVDRARSLVEYVFARPVGERGQEVGGVGVTLAALCNTYGLNIEQEWRRELARVWMKVEAIRAKQASKPTGSALPVASPPTSGEALTQLQAMGQEFDATSGEEMRLRERLEALATAEAEYRKLHDLHGGDDMRTGRAWDWMRRKGDEARAALKGAE